MQRLLNKYRSGGLVAVFLMLTALPGHAQFGGVVFDPTQSAHALQQIYQNVQNSVTWQQQLANTIQLLATADKDYQQAITTYNTIHGNLKNFSSKSIWQTIQSQLTMASFANQYGETTGLQAAMNGQAPGTSSMVWKLMNLGLNSTSSSFLSGQVLGSSHALATLTRMEAMDGVSSQCLGSVGNYNSMRNGNLLPQTRAWMHATIHIDCRASRRHDRSRGLYRRLRASERCRTRNRPLPKATTTSLQAYLRSPRWTNWMPQLPCDPRHADSTDLRTKQSSDTFDGQ